MPSYASPYYHREGPDVLIRFYISKGEICRVDLSVNSQIGMTWQLYSDQKLGSLENSICQWMEFYARKKKPLFTLPFLMAELSPFTIKVLNCIQNIPFGQTMTYREIAESLGAPLASRAVGNACARNPFPLLIPCHRVLSTGGGLGGFSAGIDIKKSLLDFEA